MKINKLTTTVVTIILIAVYPSLLSAQSASDVLAEVYNYQEISEDLSSAGQIAYDQLEAVKEAGFEVVINLAPADEGRNGLEGFLVVEQGLSYVHIPVSWSNPAQKDLQLFFDVMEANKGRKVFVHCFANMRASAFVYLYRTLHGGISEEQARADLEQIWNPEELPQWAEFIKQAKMHTGDD